MKLSISILLMLAVCAGCSTKELDRTEAKELITAYYEYPNVEVLVFNSLMGYASEYSWLLEEGYLFGHRDAFHMQITQAGKPYEFPSCNGNGWCFATNMRRFKEVTGIKYENPDKSKAVIEFTVERYNITPFGKQKKFTEGETVSYHVVVERYDDGWRITTPKEKNYKEADFPDVEEFLEN